MKKVHTTSWGWMGVILIVLGGMILSPATWADDVEDFFIQHNLKRYFDFPQDARTLALGGSNVATSADLSSVFGNPAGLGWIDACGLSLTYTQDEISGDEYLYPQGYSGFSGVEEDFDIGTARLVLPIRFGGTLGLGWSGWDSDVSDSKGTDTEKQIFQAGYGLKLNPCMSLGYSFSYYEDEVDTNCYDYEMDAGYRHTFGLQCRPNSCMTMGLSGFFAYGDAEMDQLVIGSQNGDRTSWGLELGNSWQICERTLFTTSIDYTEYDLEADVVNHNLQLFQNADEGGEAWGYHAGVEQRCCNWMVARAGYHYIDNEYDFNDGGVVSSLDEDADYHAVSTGLGFDVRKNLTLDYGFQYRFIGDGDMTNTVTATFHF
jgi:opacity protein-like surface antigen